MYSDMTMVASPSTSALAASTSSSLSFISSGRFMQAEMLILQGVREFMRQHHSVLRVLQRSVLKHEELVLVLIVKRRDLFPEEIEVFLLEGVVAIHQPHGREPGRGVFKFGVREEILHLAAQGLLYALPGDDVVNDRLQKREAADGDHRLFDRRAFAGVRGRGLLFLIGGEARSRRRSFSPSRKTTRRRENWRSSIRRSWRNDHPAIAATARARMTAARKLFAGFADAKVTGSSSISYRVCRRSG